MKSRCSQSLQVGSILRLRFSLPILIGCATHVAFGGETEFQLYKSTDLGMSWSQVGQGLPRDARINALSMAGEAVLAGTDQGMFISYDAGANWQTMPRSLEYRVLCLTTLGGHVFAGTEKFGVLVSPDAGVSWKSKNTGLRDLYIRSLLTVGTNLYAGTDKQGVFISDDQGVSWRQLRAGLPDRSQVFDLVELSGNVFAALYSKGLYRWDVESARWSKVGDVVPLELTVAGKMLVVGHNPGGVFVSEDVGKSWNDESSGLPRNAPVWTLAAEDTRVWVGTTGKVAPASDNAGLFASEDGGKSWKRSDAGLPPSSAAISFLVTNEFILVGIISPKSEQKSLAN